MRDSLFRPQLGDAEVGGDAGKHVRIVPGEGVFRYQKIDHLGERHFRGCVQVFIESHGMVV